MEFFKQIAKEPVKKVYEEKIFGVEFREVYTACPECGKKLNELHKPNYCDNCGQKLDWNKLKC